MNIALIFQTIFIGIFIYNTYKKNMIVKLDNKVKFIIKINVRGQWYVYGRDTLSTLRSKKNVAIIFSPLPFQVRLP